MGNLRTNNNEKNIPFSMFKQLNRKNKQQQIPAIKSDYKQKSVRLLCWDASHSSNARKLKLEYSFTLDGTHNGILFLRRVLVRLVDRCCCCCCCYCYVLVDNLVFWVWWVCFSLSHSFNSQQCWCFRTTNNQRNEPKNKNKKKKKINTILNYTQKCLVWFRWY